MIGEIKEKMGTGVFVVNYSKLTEICLIVIDDLVKLFLFGEQLVVNI